MVQGYLLLLLHHHQILRLYFLPCKAATASLNPASYAAPRPSCEIPGAVVEVVFEPMPEWLPMWVLSTPEVMPPTPGW